RDVEADVARVLGGHRDVLEDGDLAHVEVGHAGDGGHRAAGGDRSEVVRARDQRDAPRAAHRVELEIDEALAEGVVVERALVAGRAGRRGIAADGPRARALGAVAAGAVADDRSARDARVAFAGSVARAARAADLAAARLWRGGRHARAARRDALAG